MSSEPPETVGDDPASELDTQFADAADAEADIESIHDGGVDDEADPVDESVEGVSSEPPETVGDEPASNSILSLPMRRTLRQTLSQSMTAALTMRLTLSMSLWRACLQSHQRRLVMIQRLNSILIYRCGGR